MVDKRNYIEQLENELTSSHTFEHTGPDGTAISVKTARTLVNRIYREGAITKDMRKLPGYEKILKREHCRETLNNIK